ncbi:fatty acid desaturase 6 [Xenopus laevis]|uniref:Fatty acid desaturase 6 n=2 Tax=Xenopus laevis TaxID=8355 RepID=A0A1L8EMT8_XENLA|nr:fatty acid desaturase 6 [Xenopus laevis]OCT60657.1 hypothetical protein XELAEV_18046678mg [Xenopus laevis]
MDEEVEKITSKDVIEKGEGGEVENLSLRKRMIIVRHSSTNRDPTPEHNIVEDIQKPGDVRSPPETKDGDEGGQLLELSRLVWEECKKSSWWEKHGADWAIIGLAMCTVPAGFVCLGSSSLFLFMLGIIILGLGNSVITVKGSHLASHRSLCQSTELGRIWATFFIEVCSWLPVPCGEKGHVKQHHGHTNVIGLGDSSVWKAPYLSCAVYMFLAPLALPVLTLLVGLRYMMQMPLSKALCSLFFISLGLLGHCWLLARISGLGVGSAIGCMFLSRSMMAIPFIHVNIFQHIGLPMFSPTQRPRRLELITHSVLNLPRNLILDWTFGHTLISCHVEHHLFPMLSDHMCLKVKPMVSSFLRTHNLPYQEDTYMSRLQLFLSNYNELMVQAPPITQLVDLR